MTRCLVWVALVCTACAGPRPSPDLPWGSDLHELEQQVRHSDDFDLRCVVASQYLALVSWRELDDRVQGHYYRAVAIGHVLDLSALPDLDLIDDLEASGVRARELDPGFDGAGPLRLLAVLYWQAPAWPAGPENAQDDELIDALFREAIERAPACAENRIAYAEYLAKRGRGAEAAAHAAGARAALPHDTIATPFERRALLERLERVEAALTQRARRP